MNHAKYGLGPVGFPCPLPGEHSGAVASLSSTPAAVSHRNPENPAPCRRRGSVSLERVSPGALSPKLGKRRERPGGGWGKQQALTRS